MTYTLGGTDADSFTIVSRTGQIRVKSGTTLDHEGTPAPRTATIASLLRLRTRPTKQGNRVKGYHNVDIEVIGVDETPTFTDGDTAISYEKATPPKLGQPTP